MDLFQPWRASRVLFDDHGLLVIDKPAAMPVHGGSESLRHSVVERLADWLKEAGRDGYLGVHQRLDEPTSGVLLFTTERARNVEVARALEQRLLSRTYRAVVELARPALKPRGSLNVDLAFDGKKARVSPGRGKPALTHYRIIERDGQRALVELELDTGRPHQIRASLAHVGAPVVGDRLYGGAPAQRLMLHALQLCGGPLPRPLQSSQPASFSAALRAERPSFPGDFAAAVQDAAMRRAPLLLDTDAFRMINSEGDGMPGLTADVYGACCVLNVYAAALLPRVRGFAALLKDFGFEAVYVKKRVKADLRQQDVAELAPDEPVEVREPKLHTPRLVVDEFGTNVAVDMADGLSTGLFVDQRDNHVRAKNWARAGRVLNLFCYTSVFSVSAALSGATTTNVDLSGRALNRSRDNFALNGLDPDDHRFFKEDAMKYLQRAVRREERYDLIVLDPPSFATVGKGTFTVKGRYREAAELCVQLLAPKGRLLAVTNHTKTSSGALRKMLTEAAQRAGRGVSTLRSLPSQLDCPRASTGPWPSKSALLEVGP